MPLAFLFSREGLIILVICSVLISGAAFKGYLFGHEVCTNAQASANLSLSEKRNEIRNNRPDDAAFFHGLLNDPNW